MGARSPSLISPGIYNGATLSLSCLLVLVLAALGCGEDTSSVRPELGLHGQAVLANQSDHSGVLVKVVGLDSAAVTDAEGFFSISDIPDGHWSLVASYPYFESDTTVAEVVGGVVQSPVEMTLRQLLQFSIEPAETTISMSESGWDEYHFRMEFLGHVENVSEHPVRIIATLEPLRLLAIRPAGPSVTDYCDKKYGWLSPMDLTFATAYTFAPGEEWSPGLGLGYRFWTTCFEPGTYEVYWSILDNGHHREHFIPYSELNRTLLAKRELLRPITLTLTE
jgi:hypothetical protein